ncbi:MAG: LacI family DNA-binding transcriptional regulator [Devosia sp.]|nr:LacI family DNA-binding transcriptional regulator [Devosia sp.]
MVLARKTPTIQDVARFAKVSAATVSRVLSSPERVSASARERVTEAVRATGYTINQAARSLRMRAAKTILIALPNIGNPFYSTILDAVVNEASSRGYGVLVANRLGENPTEWLRDYFFSNRADGLLLFDASLDTEELSNLPLVRNTLPLVVVCDELLDPRFHTVTTDNFEASRRAVRHLYELGHTRIGHVRGRLVKNLANQRWLGFQAEIQAGGGEFRPDWIFQGDHSMPSGYAAGQQFARLSDRPTAIFASNDETAIGFISAIREHGLDCPRHVSIIGFDDIAVARHYAPPLTTMRQPREQIGRVATEALIDILEGTPFEHDLLRIVLNSELIVRSSTARWNGG